MLPPSAARARRLATCAQRPHQTVTSKVSTGASKSLYHARPRTFAFSKMLADCLAKPRTRLAPHPSWELGLCYPVYHYRFCQVGPDNSCYRTYQFRADTLSVRAWHPGRTALLRLVKTASAACLRACLCEVLSLNRPESWLTHPPSHLWRDKWTTLSGPLSAFHTALSCQMLPYLACQLPPCPCHSVAPSLRWAQAVAGAHGVWAGRDSNSEDSAHVGAIGLALEPLTW